MTELAAEYERWRRTGGVFDLSDRTKIRLRGGDRVRYLNGQVTADVKLLQPDRLLPACVPTVKGKLCAELFLSSLGESIVADADPSLHETLAARLERYIVADNVTLKDVTKTFELWHVVGIDPRPALAKLAGAGEDAPSARQASRLGVKGWDLLFPRAVSADARTTLLAQLAPLELLSPALADILRIEAGIPQWGAELTEETLPPEAGLDRTHISYTKGCYIGQEIISRLKSVGHVNRQLRGFIADTAGNPLSPGDGIFSSVEASPGERPLGQITSAAWSFALAKPIALGYLRRGSPEQDLFAQPGAAGVARLRISAQDLPLVPPPIFA